MTQSIGYDVSTVRYVSNVTLWSELTSKTIALVCYYSQRYEGSYQRKRNAVIVLSLLSKIATPTSTA